MDCSVKQKNEALRLETLKSYQVLDTPSDIQLDEIVTLAKNICGVPISLVSLVDENRQWFKARVGLEAKETPRDIFFCTHTIEESDILEIEDALKDERFKDNPLVTGDPFIRFYAGFPLSTESGYNLGTLCVIDREPRLLTEDQKESLRVLAKYIATYLGLRRANNELTRQQAIIEKQQNLLLEAQNVKVLTKASAKAAHEINNPLAIIQANIDILNSLDMAEAKVKVKEKLQVIYTNIERIKNIIAEMKSFSLKP